MLKPIVISGALAGLGYRSITRLVYRAAWSTDEVEHFLYFTIYGTPQEFLAADFGMRSIEAESFGLECVRAYCGEVYRLMNLDPTVDCSMRFSLGSLAGWRPRASLAFSDLSEQELVTRIASDVGQYLLPVLRRVVTSKELLGILIEDKEPWRWVTANGAIRAAQIAFLARRHRVSSVDIKAILKPFESELVPALPSGADPNDYIERIVARSVACFS